MLKSNKLEELKSQTNVLLKSSFLKSLSPLERYEFLQLCHRRLFKKDETIFYQNDPGTGLYLIDSGRVELQAQDTGEKDIRQTVILDPPESFGAFCVDHEVRRMVTARALEDTQLYGFFKPDYQSLRDRHPRIATKFLEIINSTTTRQLEMTLDRLAALTSPGQAYALLFETYNTDQVHEQVE